MPKLSEDSEHGIQLLIQNYLTLRYPRHYIWRNNTGKIPAAHGRLVSFGKAGSADLIGIAPDGKFVALEIKKPSTRNDTTAHQREFLEAICSRGGYAGVACSIEDVDAILRPQGVKWPAVLV